MLSPVYHSTFDHPSDTYNAGTPTCGDGRGHDSSQCYLPAALSDACDLQLELQVDSKTAERIHELNRLKHAAVECEDYDEAKRLKDSISRIKQVGRKLAQLEAQKQVFPLTSGMITQAF